MKEYFIIANSFAAPFFSDNSTHFQNAKSPEEALCEFAKKYNHPYGLYSAGCYKNANEYHKGSNPLAKWLSNHAKFMLDKTGLIRGVMPGKVEINGILHNIDNAKEGSVQVNA